MANPINKGSQTITINFKQTLTSERQNQAFNSIIPTGVYSGGALSIESNVARVAPLTVFISDSGSGVSLKVSTTVDYDVSEMTSSLPYVVCEFDWVNAENNFMDIKAVAIPGADEIILGRGIYSGSTLTGFDYSERKNAFLNLFELLGDELTISVGKLIVDGDFSITGTQDVEVADEIITLNSSQTGVPDPGLLSGLEIERGDSTNFQIVFRENDDVLTAGLVGGLKRVGTIKDSPDSEGLAFWNSSNGTFDTNSGLVFEEVSSDPQLSLLRTTGVARFSFGQSGDKFQSGLEYDGTSILLYPDYNGGSPRLALHPTNGFQINGTVNQWGITNSGDDLIVKNVTGATNPITIDANTNEVSLIGDLTVPGTLTASTFVTSNNSINVTTQFNSIVSSQIIPYANVLASTDLLASLQAVSVGYAKRENTYGAQTLALFKVSSGGDAIVHKIPYARAYLSDSSYWSIDDIVTVDTSVTSAVSIMYFDETEVPYDDGGFIMVTRTGTTTDIFKIPTARGLNTVTSLHTILTQEGVKLIKDLSNNKAILLSNNTISFADSTTDFATWTDTTINGSTDYYDIDFNEDDSVVVVAGITGGTINTAVSNTALTSFSTSSLVLPDTYNTYRGKIVRYFKGSYYFVVSDVNNGVTRVYKSADGLSWSSDFVSNIYTYLDATNAPNIIRSFLKTKDALYIFTDFETFVNPDGINWYSLGTRYTGNRVNNLEYLEEDFGSFITSYINFNTLSDEARVIEDITISDYDSLTKVN